MKLFKYNQFLGEKPLNENLDKAKKFLKERFLLTQAATDLGFVEGELKAQLDHKEKRSVTLGDFTPEQQSEIKLKLRELRLTDDQVRNIERDPDFLKIREYLGQKHIGWTYPFTYFYFVEMVSMEELFTRVDTETIAGEEVKTPNNVLFNLVEYSGLLDRLPKKFDANFIDINIPNNLEVLQDGLDSLEDYKKIKKVVDKLTPVLKKDYNDSPELIKNQFAEVARGFDQLGGGNEVKKEKLWKSFFGEVRTIDSDQIIHGKAYKKGDKRYFGPLVRYKDIKEFIKAAQGFLKSSDNETIVAFYDKINACNEKYGWLGAHIVFEDNGILIIEVKSFQANQMLNGHTRHCIKDSSYQWDSYVASHNNKQYYIYNFNIPQYDNYSTIGITIQPGQSIRACHAKDDAGISGSVKGILKKWEGEYDIKEDLFAQLKPMTDEEIQRRERAKIAEREIVKKGLTIEQIKQYVKEDGANINKDNAKALDNAVEEADLEKVKVILELGASPNLKKGPDAAISKAKGLDMIKLLVSYGSDMTGDVFTQVLDDEDALEYCLKAGLDPNFNNFAPFRKVTKGSWINKDQIGESYFDAFKMLLKYGAKLSDERGRNMIIKWAGEYARFDILEYLSENGQAKSFTDADWKDGILWINHSRKINEEKKKEVLDYLQNQIKEK
jgi:hypothetical protein